MDHEVTSETNHFKHTFEFIKPTKSPPRLPSPAQLHVKFVCHTVHQYFNILSCNNTADATLLCHLEEPSEEITCQFDLRAILNFNELRSQLSPVLLEFGITEDSDYHKVIVIDIGNVSQRLGRDVIHKESRGLITLQVSISKEHNMFRCEICLTQRVERESIVEAEESERVMVPASESSIKKLLKKRVRVEEGESTCSVCLEEFRAGTYETSMDCSHVFHRECIGKWLRQSHYCPVCRYEMPTDDDEGSFHQDDELVDRFGLTV